MNTRIREITNRIEENDIIFEEAANVLKNGGLVAFPTETVYGLGADAMAPEACKKIFTAKGRPQDNPLIVHIAEKEVLKELVAEIPQKANDLVEKFWPGPLTVILRKKPGVNDTVTGGNDTVAVRMPSHETARRLIRAAGGFIAAPSANRSGRPSPTKGKHVIEDLDGIIDMIVVDDSVTIGLESTIVDLSVDPPCVLRPGYITKEDLEEIAGPVRESYLNKTADDKSPKAPGMKYRHYAPKAPVFIVKGAKEEVIEKINEMALLESRKGKKTAVIMTDETKEEYTADVLLSLGRSKNDEKIALSLFDALREADTMEADVIFSESFEETRLGKAIMNRLIKAANNNIILL